MKQRAVKPQTHSIFIQSTNQKSSNALSGGWGLDPPSLLREDIPVALRRAPGFYWLEFALMSLNSCVLSAALMIFLQRYL